MTTMKRTLIILLATALLLCLILFPSFAWHPLNDTGIQFCGEAIEGNNDPCIGKEPWGQDAHYGRDAQAKAGRLTKVGAGAAGFDFTKISNIGHELPASAQLGINRFDWACTMDNVTGIMWEVKVNDVNHLRHKDHTYFWYFTKSPDGNPGYQGYTATTCNHTLGGDYCNTERYIARVNLAGLCGYNDWRLPTIKELESIAHHEQYDPAVDKDYYPNTSNSTFWSISPNAASSDFAWGVGFSRGETYNDLHRGNHLRVRLARGGKPFDPQAQADHCMSGIPPANPDSIYDDNENGTLTDTRTGLTWKRCSEGQTWTGSTCSGSASPFSWAQALEHAQSHVYAGHNDWRLPNVKELRSLVEECRSKPSINETMFPNTPNSAGSPYFWSASPNASYANCAWDVNFKSGYSHYVNRGSFNRSNVRLVRGGNSFYLLPRTVLPGVLLLLLLDDE